MQRPLAFLRDLFSGPRAATREKRSTPAADLAEPVSAGAAVAGPRWPPWMELGYRSPRYKEEEDLQMGRARLLEHATDVLRTFDPEAGIPQDMQMSLVFRVLELAAGEPWPLESMTRGQAFAALARGLRRIEEEDGRTVLRLLFDDVRALLVRSEEAFAAGASQLGYDRLREARAELERALRDTGITP